jgi:hypothetical protein
MGHADPVAFLFQIQADQLAYVFIVVNDQDMNGFDHPIRLPPVTSLLTLYQYYGKYEMNKLLTLHQNKGESNKNAVIHA